MSSAVINLEERSEIGRNAKFLRLEGILPGSINRPGAESQNVQMDSVDFEKIYKEYGRTQPIEIEVAGKKDLVMVKDIDREPVKGKMLHFTLQVVKRDQEVSAEIPIHYDEDVEIPAKKLGLELLAVTHSIEVKALPQNLPEGIIVDASGLKEVGDRILVQDLKMPAGCSLDNEEDAEKVVFIVEAPRITSEEDLSNDAPEGADASSVVSDKGGADSDADKKEGADKAEA